MSQIVARASNTVRNKNLLMVLLCLGFMGWFAYDGFISWPARNDDLVRRMKAMTLETPPRLSTIYAKELDAWKGWNSETDDARTAMDRIAKEGATVGRLQDWKSPLDLTVQRGIVAGLGLAVLAAVWWFVHCQARRVIADENTVSPAKDVVIPWDKILVVDNTRWKKSGIVDITYLDEKGERQQAKFDDYETEREPLIQILDRLGEKAVKAEFLPKEEKAAEGTT